MKDCAKSNDLKWMESGSGCLDLVMMVWHVLHFVRMRLTRIIDMMYEPPYVNKSSWSCSIFFIRTASIFYRSEALGGKHHQSIGASDILYCSSSALWSASLLSFFLPLFCWPYNFQKYPLVHTQTRNRFSPFAAVETFPYFVVTGASPWPFNDHTGR